MVQDTFIKVHQNIGKFRYQCAFSSWLLRICHNRCLDLLRLKQRRGIFQTIALDGQSAEEYNLPFNKLSQLPDHSPGPAQQLESIEQGRVVAESLQKLPHEQRVVLVLHDIEGFSYQEVAEIVGEKIGTVRSRLHYGRLRLRQLLNPYFSFTTLSLSR